jgi:hypothetical protein
MSKFINALLISSIMTMSGAALADSSKMMGKDMMNDKAKMGDMKKSTMMNDKMHKDMNKDNMGKDEKMMKSDMKKMDSMKKMK